jgi:hypothetical protein
MAVAGAQLPVRTAAPPAQSSGQPLDLQECMLSLVTTMAAARLRTLCVVWLLLQVPFKVNCPVPGMFRWVTTNIARWDPSIAWPTDLDCEFTWNTAMKTFDGALQQLHMHRLMHVYAVCSIRHS